MSSVHRRHLEGLLKRTFEGPAKLSPKESIFKSLFENQFENIIEDILGAFTSVLFLEDSSCATYSLRSFFKLKVFKLKRHFKYLLSPEAVLRPFERLPLFKKFS